MVGRGRGYRQRDTGGRVPHECVEGDDVERTGVDQGPDRRGRAPDGAGDGVSFEVDRHEAVPWLRTTAGFGMVVFLATDVMLFAPFFAAYFLLRGTTEEWPPAGVELDVARAAVATILLVMSSITLMAADRALALGRRRVAGRYLLVTALLGLVFLVNQLDEYAGLEFSADAHPYGSSFWLLTGLHGVHVAAGVGAILLLFVRSVRARELVAVEPFAGAVSAYWHLVDVVWIGVFGTIWVIR
jgi:cytochrome c oxidase subunit III